MAGNTFGNSFRVTTFGESHGAALGVIIDGCPAGMNIDLEKLQHALDRRKPGAKSNVAVTARKEDDKAEILSGIFEGKSTGTPISILIKNTSQRSSDYGNLATTFRPGHADYTYYEKYGIRDYRGGGRSSGRETAARVAAGAIANQILENILGKEYSITAYTRMAAGIECFETDFSVIEKNPLRACDLEAAERMAEHIEQIRKNGDSTGGIVECRIKGIPAGLGEPVFDKLDALLAHAMLSIGAIKGIEFGSGFEAAKSLGSKNNDPMRTDENGKVRFESNNAGGILGGISNGNDIYFTVAVKPVPSIFQKQQTISLEEAHKYTNSDLVIEGRHDVCLCPRIIPVVEAMAAITLADLLLRNRTAKI
ncbi:MAG: chorismate synthase [Treponema sp.]|nr:chorismate synthase [Treponema sp.]